jgi:hypothetical protein
MVERIVVLLKVLSKVSDPLYMLRCPGRSYPARYTATLVTSRDPAILLLYRCLRHFHTEHELRAIFHHLNFLKSDRTQIALFENSFTNENFSFLSISCTRNRHSTMIEDYIKRDDVIWCELDRLALTEIESRLRFLKFVVQTREFLSDSFCVSEIGVQQWSKFI